MPGGSGLVTQIVESDANEQRVKQLRTPVHGRHKGGRQRDDSRQASARELMTHLLDDIADDAFYAQAIRWVFFRAFIHPAPFCGHPGFDSRCTYS